MLDFLKLKKHLFSALQVAKLYTMENVHRLHTTSGYSFRDKIFTSLLWTELFTLSGTNLRTSSTSHPEK